MSKYLWGPVLDSALFGGDDLRSMMNRKSDFYPYDVEVKVDNKNKPLEYYIEIALAGISKDAISVQLTDEGGLNVTVSPDKKNNDDIQVLRRSISYAKRSITFDLTKDIDIKNISSKYENGLLTISIPVIVEKSKARSIKIG